MQTTCPHCHAPISVELTVPVHNGGLENDSWEPRTPQLKALVEDLAEAKDLNRELDRHAEAHTVAEMFEAAELPVPTPRPEPLRRVEYGKGGWKTWPGDQVAIGVNERSYVLVVTARFEDGETIADPDSMALFVKASIPEESGITTVEPWVRIQLEGCEPIELLRKESAAFARVSNDMANSHGCPEVELVGPRPDVLTMLMEHWDMDQDQLDELGYELR